MSKRPEQPRTIKLQLRHFTLEELSVMAERARRLAQQCNEVHERNRCDAALLKASVLGTIASACVTLAMLTPAQE